MAICDGDPLTRVSNAGGVGRNRDSEPISGFTACCQRCNRPGVMSTTPPDHGPARCDTIIAGIKRRSLLMAGDDDEIFVTRSLNVMPQTTEHRI